MVSLVGAAGAPGSRVPAEGQATRGFVYMPAGPRLVERGVGYGPLAGISAPCLMPHASCAAAQACRLFSLSFAS